nr:MAG TPA: hypothetical protein [Caudoviricetes sp.]
MLCIFVDFYLYQSPALFHPLFTLYDSKMEKSSVLFHAKV